MTSENMTPYPLWQAGDDVRTYILNCKPEYQRMVHTMTDTMSKGRRTSKVSSEKKQQNHDG